MLNIDIRRGGERLQALPFFLAACPLLGVATISGNFAVTWQGTGDNEVAHKQPSHSARRSDSLPHRRFLKSYSTIVLAVIG